MFRCVGKLVVTVAVAAALVLGAVALRTRPTPPVPAPAAPATPPIGWAAKAEAPAQRLFGHLAYTQAQSAALVEAGFAIHAGKRPSETLSAASLATLRQVRGLFDGVGCTAPGPCTHYRRDVLACMDEAAELIGIQLRRVEPIARELFIAAMGVSVVTREVPYQTPAALAEFCRKLVVKREELRPSQPTG
jgi:hypothetical protein